MLKYFILFTALVFNGSSFAANPTKQLKKQMCFETYPRVTYDTNGMHEWTIDEVISNPELYRTYQFTVADKKKGSDGYFVFEFMGRGKFGTKILPVSGTGVYDENVGWTLNVETSAVVGSRYSSENQPLVSSQAVWDMYNNISQPGIGKSVVQNLNTTVQSSYNLYEVTVVKQIDCMDFESTVPLSY